MNAKEDAKRSLEGLNADGSVGKKVLGGAGAVVDTVAGNTVGFVAKLAQDKLLGDVPEEAVEGSYQETIDRRRAKESTEADDELMQKVEGALLTSELQAGIAGVARAERQ